MIVGGSPFNASPIGATNRIIEVFTSNISNNLRILYNNVADLATLSASNTSGSLVINNVKTEYKGEVHRSTGINVAYTLTWSSDQTIGCVCMPCTNLSSTSILRIKLYDASSNLREYTGDVYATSQYVNTSIQDVNNFAYGGFSKSVFWFPSKPNYVRSMVIELSDPDNTVGYIDNSRIIAGDYWSPTYNLEKGMQASTIDSSTISESNAGSLIYLRGFIRDKLTIDFALIPEIDRSTLLNIIKSAGIHKNILLSVFPETYNSYENDFLIYGKRSNAPIVNSLYGFYKNTLEITSW